MKFIYGLAISVILFGGYYEVKVAPQLDQLQDLQGVTNTQAATITSQSKTLDTDKQLAEIQKTTIKGLESQVNVLQAALTQAKAKMTEEETKTQPQAISAPTAAIAEEASPVPSGFHQVEDPDGTIRTYPNLPTSGDVTHLPDTDPNAAIKAEIEQLQAKVVQTQDQHDQWLIDHSPGGKLYNRKVSTNIPDNLSTAAIQDLQQQIAQDEQQLQ